MNTQPAYSNWHPRRLPERTDSLDSQKIFSSRPPTPMFGRDTAEREGPSGPGELRRHDSQTSLLTLQMDADAFPVPPPRRNLHQRARSYAQRVPLPQGISVTVGICTGLAFILSVTTLIIGLSNRRMLLDATEARHDPHGPLASLIYTSVLHALEHNMTRTPIDSILPDPN
ncbi:MAG: hypothetical protein EOO38_00220 [Cytophagaceae bacterium]|nr:MAG: hypothetical protein EOO38_00220 [Cytophagaceae bacterium]